MTMQRLYLPSLKSIFILSLIAVISACGSDGGKKPPVIVPDTTPSAFSFTAVTGAAVSSEVTSTAITIAGIDTATAISITGGTYAIGTGAFTASAGTVTTGQTVKVKVTTSASNSTAVTATLTVGGVTGSFSVTTVADTTPNAFTFTAATAVQPGSVNTSAAITVAGVDVAVPISITGGEYSINGGTYTNVAGTVSAAQTVTVKTTASAAPLTPVDVVLTIGGVSATYTVTTAVDTVAPTAQILFPPPVSMTEGNTILVRGTASDASTIQSVKVNGVTATTTDGFANWQATVPLTDTTVPVTATTGNTITVVTEDSAGNIASNAAHVAIRQAPITSSFPDSDNSFTFPWGLAIDRLDGRNRLLVTQDVSANIISIDLTNGKRTVFATVSGCTFDGIVISSIKKHAYTACGNTKVTDINLTDASYSLSNAGGLLLPAVSFIEDSNNKIVMLNDDGGAIITIDHALSSFNVFSDATKTIPDANNRIKNGDGIAEDKAHNRYIVADEAQQTIFTVDMTTGVRSVFSNNATGTGDSFGPIGSKYIAATAIDDPNNRVLVAEASASSLISGKIFSIDLTTGNRSLFSSATTDNPYNLITNSYGVAIADPKGYVFFSDIILNAVFAVDMVTGHRVVFSK